MTDLSNSTQLSPDLAADLEQELQKLREHDIQTMGDAPAIGQMAAAALTKSAETVVADIESAVKAVEEASYQLRQTGDTLSKAIKARTLEFGQHVKEFTTLAQTVALQMRQLENTVSTFGREN